MLESKGETEKLIMGKKKKDWLVYIPYPDHSPFGPKPNLNGAQILIPSEEKAPQPIELPTNDLLREKNSKGSGKTQPALR